MAALIVAACVPAAAPAPAPPAPPAPLAEPQIFALAELLRMEDERQLDSARWGQLLQDAHPEVRSRAALAAGRIADPRAASLLLSALADSAVGVRASAAFALGRLPDTSSRVITGLRNVLALGDSAALEVPAALARLNTPAGYEVVRSRLAQLGPKLAPAGAPLARECLLALWRFGLRPGAAELAATFTAANHPEVRWAAVYALTRTGSASTVPRVLELLTDPDPLIRATAARGVRAGLVDSVGIRPLARERLRLALDDQHPHVRINAVRALAAFRDSADAAPLLTRLQDADGNVRLAVVEALAGVPGSAATGGLRTLAADPGHPLALRAAALSGLARHDTAAAHRLAAEWAGATTWIQRFYAVRTLAPLDWTAREPLLRRLSRDPDHRVQGEAFGALAAADTTLPLSSLFLEGLAAPDPLVRAHAANGLAARHDPAFYSALMQAYDRAQRDTINDARLAAVAALARLVDYDVPVARSFFLRFPRSSDPVTRARVARHFGTDGGSWGPAQPTGMGRNAAFYQQLVRAALVPATAEAAHPRVVIRTARGDVVLALEPASAPLTVHNFLTLIESGFYRRPELRWHRVVPNFVLQDGDPRGDGSGGPGQVIRDEINLLRYRRGTLGMALSGPDTGGSQFFITHSPQPHLDGGYTIFGTVVEGMDVVDAILQDDPIIAIEIVR